MWRRRSDDEPVIERIDVDAVHSVLFDILRELRSIKAILEDDDGSEEELADDDS